MRRYLLFNLTSLCIGHWTRTQIFGVLNFEVWGLICGNDPCITQLQTVVEKGFTNVLEVKNYQDMYRGLLKTRLCKKKNYHFE